MSKIFPLGVDIHWKERFVQRRKQKVIKAISRCQDKGKHMYLFILTQVSHDMVYISLPNLWVCCVWSSVFQAYR